MDATPVEPGDADNVSFCNNVEGSNRRAGRHLARAGRTSCRRRRRSSTSTDPASPGLSGTPADPRHRRGGIDGARLRGSELRGRAGRHGKRSRAWLARDRRRGRGGGHRRLLGDRHRRGRQHLGLLGADLVHAPEARRASPPPPPACVVPKLAGKKLKAAKRKIRAADCKVGKVRKPKGPKGKGRVLVVKSSNPAAGTSSADGKVHLRLGPKPPK